MLPWRSGGEALGEVIDILYEDRHLLVVSKPAGIDVHGVTPDQPGTLVSVVARQLGLDPRRLHPAARLDRPVSGAVPLALSKLARRQLTQQYQRREISRRYLALVLGVPEPSSGVWEGAIGLDRHDPRRRVIGGRQAQPALTDYAVLELLTCGAFVELRPKTGRTHQLRVHASALGRCPLLGDRRYGGPSAVTLGDGAVLAIGRVMLHAARISLGHPESGELLELEAPLTADFAELAARLRC